jgi:hypothetical protein
MSVEVDGDDAVPAAGLRADAVSPTAVPWLLELLVVLVLLPPPIATETVGDTVGCVDGEAWASVGGGGRGSFGFGGAAAAREEAASVRGEEQERGGAGGAGVRLRVQHP